MGDLHTDFIYRKIKRPNRVLAWVVRFAFRVICKKRNVSFVFDEDYLQMQDKQMVVLCQHRSRLGYIYTFAGLKRTNIHILCGYQNIFEKWIYPLLKHLGVIAKMLYQPDVQATMQLMRVAKQGNSIMIFPEGIQSTSGSTHPINPATMKLLAKLKLPVALVTLKGAYFTRPRYCADVKKGKITVHYRKLFDGEDFSNYSQETLYNHLLQQFQYNEFAEHQEEKVAFRGKKPNISGLDNIIFRCPECGAEYQFVVENDTMRCTQCGFGVSMDEYYDITATKGNLPFPNIDAWYQWQRKVIAQQVRDDSFLMSSRVRIGRINTKKLTSNHSLQYYGEGTLTLTNKGLTYSGTQDGEAVTLTFEPKLVFSLSMSLSSELDLYYNGTYYNFKLLENEKQVAKWMLSAEEIHNMYDPVWSKASSEVYYEA